MITDSAKLLEHKRHYDSKVYINMFTLEIVCFRCNLEILDEMFTLEAQKKLIVFKGKVKEMVINLINRTMSNPRFTIELKLASSTHVGGINHLNMPSLVFSYPIFFYLLWAVPYFRFVKDSNYKVLKRIYLLELQNIFQDNNCLLGSTIFKLSRVVYHIDSEHPVDLMALQEAISEFSERNQAYRVTGTFDIFEALSDFLSFAHIQLSNTNIPGKSSLISSPTLRKLMVPGSEDKTGSKTSLSA